VSNDYDPFIPPSRYTHFLSRALKETSPQPLPTMSRSRNSVAMGFALLAWIGLLFSPLAFVQTVSADDADNYGTVIGIDLGT
jgi:hypothetical protein